MLNISRTVLILSGLIRFISIGAINIVHKNNICPIAKCDNPCGECSSGKCTAEPRVGLVDGRECPVCPVLKRCLEEMHDPREEDGSSLENSVDSCPLVRCDDPCDECPSGICTSEVGIYTLDGKKCPGCPRLDKCIHPNNRQEKQLLGHLCPTLHCSQDPCDACSSGRCTTKPSFLDINGHQCDGCPELDMCVEDEPAPSGETVLTPLDLCPIPLCAEPCAECPTGQCETEPGFYELHGRACPGCPVLVACFDKAMVGKDGDVPSKENAPKKETKEGPIGRFDDCPFPICTREDPCGECDSNKCETKTAVVNYKGKQCPGCDEFVKCIPTETKPELDTPRKPDDETREAPNTETKAEGEGADDGAVDVDEESEPPIERICCSGPKPSQEACGPKGCICCSDGKWVKRTNGSRAAVCRRHGLARSRGCPKKCCSEPEPSSEYCGKKGCRCCSDGTWRVGKKKKACNAVGLRVSNKCETQERR